MELKHTVFGLATMALSMGVGAALAQEEIIFGISASSESLQEQPASEFARRAPGFGRALRNPLAQAADAGFVTVKQL